MMMNMKDVMLEVRSKSRDMLERPIVVRAGNKVKRNMRDKE